MEDVKTLKELYKKVTPALTTKRNELIRNNIKFVMEKDIFDYHKSKWKNTNNLDISTIVDDILNTDDKMYEEYVLKKLRKDDNK